MNRWARRLVLASMVAFPIGAAAPAAAQACPPLDVSCAAEDLVGGVVRQIGDPDPGDLVDDTVGTVDDAVGTVDDTVDDAIGTIDDAPDEIDDIVNPPGPAPPPDDDEAGNDDEGGTRGGPDDERAGAIPSRIRSSGDRMSPGPRLSAGTPLGFTETSSRTFDPVLDETERIGSAIAAAVPSLMLVLVLLAIVIGFVTVQGRLDRKDPRLALAPVGTEIVSFR